MEVIITRRELFAPYGANGKLCKPEDAEVFVSQIKATIDNKSFVSQIKHTPVEVEAFKLCKNSIEQRLIYDVMGYIRQELFKEQGNGAR